MHLKSNIYAHRSHTHGPFNRKFCFPFLYIFFIDTQIGLKRDCSQWHRTSGNGGTSCPGQTPLCNAIGYLATQVLFNGHNDYTNHTFKNKLWRGKATINYGYAKINRPKKILIRPLVIHWKFLNLPPEQVCHVNLLSQEELTAGLNRYKAVTWIIWLT